MPEVAKAMWNAGDETDWPAVLEMAERVGISVVLRRLGYVLNLLETEQDVADSLKNRFKGYSLLDPIAQKKSLAYSKEYGVIINRSRRHMLDWMEH